MAYDDTLARRARTLLAGRPGIDERSMFGGLAFLDRGHMACGLVGDELMVRVGEAAYDDALRQPHVRPMDFTGRPLKGMIYVGKKGIADDAGLRAWIERGLAFTSTQPAKVAKAPKPKAPKPKAPAKVAAAAATRIAEARTAKKSAKKVAAKAVAEAPAKPTKVAAATTASAAKKSAKKSAARATAAEAPAKPAANSTRARAKKA